MQLLPDGVGVSKGRLGFDLVELRKEFKIGIEEPVSEPSEEIDCEAEVAAWEEKRRQRSGPVVGQKRTVDHLSGGSLSEDTIDV